MPNYSREHKRKLGAVLLKLQKKEPDFTEEEWQLAKVLEGQGLAKYLGPDPSPKIMPIEEVQKQMQLSALATFVLSGMGEDFVLRNSEDKLRDGKFLLPTETAWYDSWPWKLVWPALVSVITTLIVQAIRGCGGR